MSLQSFDDEPMTFEEATDEQPTEAQYQPPEQQYRKQGFTIYSMMLLLSFLFLTAASIIFFNYTE